MMESTGTVSARDYEQMQADAFNAQPGGMADADCAMCLNKGYVAYVKTETQPSGEESVAMMTRECECWKEREFNRNLRDSGLEDLARRCTFEKYIATQSWQATAKKMAERFVGEADGDWFLAAGNPGSGKTHLCTAMCLGLLKRGKAVKYMLWRDAAVAIKAVVNDGEKYRELLDPLKKAPVLYIDDFLKTRKNAQMTDGDINLAFELINCRYNDSNLITIISTEKTVKELVGIDEAMGSRIAERSKGYSLIFEGKDKNLRLKVGG